MIVTCNNIDKRSEHERTHHKFQKWKMLWGWTLILTNVCLLFQEKKSREGEGNAFARATGSGLHILPTMSLKVCQRLYRRGRPTSRTIMALNAYHLRRGKKAIAARVHVSTSHEPTRISHITELASYSLVSIR